MVARIAGLVVLAILGTICLWDGAFWIRVVSTDMSETVRNTADYRAQTYLVAFGLVAAIWIWLLVKTVRYRRDFDDDDDGPMIDNDFEDTEKQ